MDSQASRPDLLQMDHPQDEDIERASEAIKALAHPIRLKILCRLADSKLSVGDLTDICETSQSNLSRHLSVLKGCGFLTAERDANFVYYRISDPRTLSLMQLMREIFCATPR